MAKEINPDRWCEGRVQALQKWTDTLFSIRVEAEVQPFAAGQFTKLGMMVGGEFVERPYSYVNAPHERPLEFYFVTVPDGPLTSRMVDLQPGDPIWVMRRPAGFLTLDEVPPSKHLWMLSTGTAIGPFLSILKTEQPWKSFEQIILVHAVRLAAELSFSDTIESLKQRYPQKLQFVPFVSREDTDFAIRARIPAALSDGRLEARVGLQINPDISQVMICGNPDMVKSTQSVLIERGLERNRRRMPGHISIENYW